VVLNELIQNAIQHGLGDGQGTVTVELHGGDDQPVVLQVHDNGSGAIPAQPTPAKPSRVLGPPEGERSRVEEGAQPAVHSPGGSPGGGLNPGGGLGLRLVRALVEEELNGRFTLIHPAGRGSVATAVIPPVERTG
jgi:two-component sensor histidine kinase